MPNRHNDGMMSLRAIALATVGLGGAAIAPSQIVLKPSGEPGVKLRIRSLKADATIRGQVAKTDITLTFQNPTEGNEEAEFIYALPPDTVVTSFAYYFQEERVPAKVAEKERAVAIYKHITTRRRDPALIEMTGKRTFRARIFPVAPTADLRVEMTLIQALPNRRGAYTYVLPIRRAKGDPFDELSFTATTDHGLENNFGLGAISTSSTAFYRYAGVKVRPDRDLRFRSFESKPKPLDANLDAARSGGRDGFFTLFLTPGPGKTLSGPVHIEGIRVYGLRYGSAKSAKAGNSIVVTGRYHGSGDATVRWGGEEAKLFFPDRAIPNHPSMKLWAAREIEALGSARKQVVALSIRHNLPSRFTSWIAIPIAEREQYRMDKLWEEQERLGKSYVAALGPNYEGTPRSNAIRTRIHAVAKELGVDPKSTIQEALAQTKRELARRAASDLLMGQQESPARHRLSLLIKDTGEDLDSVIKYSAREHMRTWLWQYADAINANKETSPEGRALAEKVRRGQEMGWVPRGALESNLYQMMEAAAYRIAQQTIAGKAAPRGEIARIRRLGKRSGISPEERIEFAETNLAVNEATQLLWGLKERIENGKSQTPEARKAREQIRTLMSKVRKRHLIRLEPPTPEMRDLSQRIARAKLDNEVADGEVDRLKTLSESYGVDPDLLVYSSLRNLYEPIWWSLWSEGGKSRLDEAKIAKLRAERDRFRALGLSDIGDPNRYAYSYRESYWLDEYLVRRELLTEMRRVQPDPDRLARLGKELGVFSQYHSLVGPISTHETGADRARIYTDLRIERLQTDVLLDKLERETPSPEVIARRKRLEAKAQELRARMGDPLLTFDAPATAQRVVAVMPDGEVKPMAWVPLRNRWEVRFDVPAGAKEGEVAVQIVAVLRDGRRQTGTTTYHVDMTPPQAKVRILRTNAGLRLEVNGSADLGRVTAVLPNGEEVDIPRLSEGRFSFLGTSLAKGDRVRFILLDRAHNRAEVEAVVP